MLVELQMMEMRGTGVDKTSRFLKHLSLQKKSPIHPISEKNTGLDIEHITLTGKTLKEVYMKMGEESSTERLVLL